MSTRIRRLHHDASGLASVEYILAIPVFVVMLLVIMDLGRYRTAMVHATIAARNSAWSESVDGACWYLDEMPDFVAEQSTIFSAGCERNPDRAAGSGFWQALDNAGGQRLTATVSGTPAPSLVTGSTTLFFEPHPWTSMVYQPNTFDFSLYSHETFTHDAASLGRGYDSEMRARLGSGTGRLLDLFPRVFPGAR